MADLLDLVKELLSLNDGNLSERVIKDNDVQWCLSELNDMLEAEAEPVKRGRWLQPKSGECFCSECKTLGSPQWKRCPICEAKMYGGDAE